MYQVVESVTGSSPSPLIHSLSSHIYGGILLSCSCSKKLVLVLSCMLIMWSLPQTLVQQLWLDTQTLSYPINAPTSPTLPTQINQYWCPPCFFFFTFLFNTLAWPTNQSHSLASPGNTLNSILVQLCLCKPIPHELAYITVGMIMLI